MFDDEAEATVEKINHEGAILYVLCIPADPEFPPALSSSEREVIELVLAGKSNAEIAHQRGTATQTVANQLRSAYQKVGVSSRGELAAVLFGHIE